MNVEEKTDDQNYKPPFSIPSREVQSTETNVKKEDVTTISTNAAVKNVKEKVNEYLERCSDGSYRCTVCGKTKNNRNAAQNLRNHIQTHLEGLSFSCDLCQRNFTSLWNLEQHNYKTHKP